MWFVWGQQVRIVSERDEAAVMASLFAPDQLETRFAGGANAYVFDPDAYLAATYPAHLALGRTHAPEAHAEANAAAATTALAYAKANEANARNALASSDGAAPPRRPAADPGAEAAAASSSPGSEPGQHETCPGDVEGEHTREHFS